MTSDKDKSHEQVKGTSFKRQGTSDKDRSHEQVTRKSHMNKSQGQVISDKDKNKSHARVTGTSDK